MTKPPLLALCLLTLALLSPAADTSADALTDIRQLYAKIGESKPTSTKTIEFNFDDDPFEGTITYNSYPGGLTHIFLSYIAGDHGGDDEHYYFGPDGLFFIFQQSSSWRFGPQKSDGTPTSIDSLRERRFYFKNGTCIHQLERRGESADAGQLSAIVGKLPQNSTTPDSDARRLFMRALALKSVTNAGEATGYFEAEFGSD